MAHPGPEFYRLAPWLALIGTAAVAIRVLLGWLGVCEPL